MSSTSSETSSDAVRPHHAFGVDIGGSGIKAAIVELETGEFLKDRHKITTPQPATPDAVAETVATLVRHFEWADEVGVALPSVVKHQTAYSAANIDPSWIGTNLTELFERHLPHNRIVALNDADAAGIAEVAYGEEQARQGSAVFLTVGTGIGSAFLLDGALFPNTEIGHMLVNFGKKLGIDEAEHLASSAVKDRKDLSYQKWAKRVDKVFHQYETLFNPSCFIVGGGISRDHEKWVPLLTIDTPVLPARLRNRAGIVGAAIAITDNIAP